MFAQKFAFACAIHAERIAHADGMYLSHQPRFLLVAPLFSEGGACGARKKRGVTCLHKCLHLHVQYMPNALHMQMQYAYRTILDFY